MKPKDIFKYWNGKRVDENNKDYQCVAWAKQFAFAFTGVKLGSFSWTAFKWWESWSPFDDNWTKISASTGKCPIAWDIVFFKPTKANWMCGHVAVAENCTPATLTVWEQNAGTGNGDGLWPNAIMKRVKNYKDMLGFYRYTKYWNGEHPNSVPTRLECATMLIRWSGEEENLIWNKERQYDIVSLSEMQIMQNRAFGKQSENILTRQQLADFIHENI